MFSLAGIPPLFGFWPKLMVFRAAIGSGYVLLAVAGIIGTVVGAYYYLKIVKVMYMDEPAEVMTDGCDFNPAGFAGFFRRHPAPVAPSDPPSVGC